MAYVCIVINVPGESVTQLNAVAQTVNTVSQEVNLLGNLLDAINGGMAPASLQVTTRDTDPAISTHGANSIQATYSHL